MPRQIELIIDFDGERFPIGGRSWRDATANQLVVAARGKFLPMNAVPLRLTRDEKPVAFFDPDAPLRFAGPQDGVVLEATVDRGQFLEAPCFLWVLRGFEVAKRQIVEECNAEALAAGYDPINLS